ncbi:hypothetical protein F2Q68_00031628 [Brassica cretica]|uniref:Uncharacterized protein n=1 Tax=Brassica cretica TaxID=69181 RepID=A0A8S9G749_BRACR|nr:hypothetical protein F2Q68_00031628 [Brassica cretica]
MWPGGVTSEPFNVAPKARDLFATLIRKLRKDSFRLQRFPLSLQLVAFRAIPQLLSYIPVPTDTYGPGRSSSTTTSLHLFQRHLPHGISPRSLSYTDYSHRKPISQAMECGQMIPKKTVSFTWNS